MTNVVQFPANNDSAALLERFADRARAGEFAGALVATIGSNGAAEFQMSLGEAEPLLLIGLIEVAKARLLKVAEAAKLSDD